jgi:5'-nucleotidase
LTALARGRYDQADVINLVVVSKSFLGGPALRILLTNDDGVFAPGLRALRKELMRLGEVTVIAPAVEQSGVGHSITFLSPLVVKEVEDEDGSTLGWMVEGSPADSVKLAICELMPRPPDLIVSGINAGANAGINVLYSGTVAAAIEGAFFKITSIAVSLELADHFDYPQAARQSAYVVEQILAHSPAQGSLFNVNLPAMSRGEPKGIRVVPMGVGRHGEGFERRMDPRGRTYYWMTYAPPFHLEGPETDVTSLSEGYITVTPLHFDMTRMDQLRELNGWDWGNPPGRSSGSSTQYFPTQDNTP